MSSSVPTTTNENRKIQRRSRFGCRNCKLRKVKCDETKPNCMKCGSFGIICNFMHNVADLQPIVSNLEKPPTIRGKMRLAPPPDHGIWTKDSLTTYHLSPENQGLLMKYLEYSLKTRRDPNMADVNREAFALSFSHPYLMHASLAVALAFDQYRTKHISQRRRVELCYHSSQSIKLFNNIIQQPIASGDKDAIWATAAALVVLSFASPDNSEARTAWPLKASDPFDLEWMRMNRGKMSLWHVADPLRPDSIFRALAGTYAQMRAPTPEKGAQDVPTELASLCSLNESSTAKNNPYFDAVHSLAPLYRLSDDKVTLGYTEPFMRSVDGAFGILLRGKDPVALILLYLWYRKAGMGNWWIQARAEYECPAIRLYLKLHHAANEHVQMLLSGERGSLQLGVNDG